MFGRLKFSVTDPGGNESIAFPNQPLPPDDIKNRTFKTILLGAHAGQNGLWVCGSPTSSLIQGRTSGSYGPWAIWANPLGRMRPRVLHLPSPAAGNQGGSIPQQDQLHILTAVQKPNKPSDPIEPGGHCLIAADLHLLDSELGLISSISLSHTAEYFSRALTHPFIWRSANVVHAVSNEEQWPTEFKCIISLEDGLWQRVWVPPTTLPTVELGPGNCSAPWIAGAPKVALNGDLLVPLAANFRPAGSPEFYKVAALCQVNTSCQNTWVRTFYERGYDIVDIHFDLDVDEDIYLGLSLGTKNTGDPSKVNIMRLSAEGSGPGQGWSRTFQNIEGMKLNEIKVGSREIFAAGIKGRSFEDRRPFVLSLKRDGTPTSLVNSEFREAKEEWLMLKMAIHEEDFFLIGYTYTSSDKEPSKTPYHIHLAKFDRYGVLI